MNQSESMWRFSSRFVWSTLAPGRGFRYRDISAVEALGERISVGGLDMVEKAKLRPNQGSRAASLNREQAVYESNLSRRLSDHEGEYVLIKDDQVGGFYESRDEALTAGYTRFGIGPLFLKQVSPSEPVHHIPNAII
jgi:hypothetical protein